MQNTLCKEENQRERKGGKKADKDKQGRGVLTKRRIELIIFYMLHFSYYIHFLLNRMQQDLIPRNPHPFN